MFFKKKDFGSSIDLLIVGLGNPGSKYENTRHNAGFICIDKIAENLQVKMTKIKFKSYVGEGKIADKKILLMKPTTYMNLSGEAVMEAVNFYKLQPEQVLVVFDDISLEPGKVRIRRKGSHGGHNGIRNIIERMGKDTFPRVKVGVGKKPHPEYDLADWVLSRFTDKEMKEIDEVAKNTIKIAELAIDDNLEKAMNLFNS